MTKTIVSLVCLCLGGCASQAPTLHVTDQAATRIGALDRQRLANTDEKDITRAHDELARAQGELGRAEDMVRTVTAERRAATDPQVARVLDVKSRWATARVQWRQVQVECARRHEWTAIGKDELDKAEIVSRNGVDLDVDAFRGQYARTHEGWSKCNAQLTKAHAAADAAEGQLAAVKSQYAHDRLVAAQPPPGSTQAAADPVK